MFELPNLVSFELHALLLMEAEHRMDSFDVAADRNDAVSDQFWGWQERLSRILAPDLHRRYRSDNYSRSLFGRTWHRLLVIELKVDEFRRRHDRLPQSLSELHLEDGKLPLDPFSDRPLIYEVSDDDYRLYSVGRDGIDNGGNFDASKARYHDGYDLDLATLWRKGESGVYPD